MSDSVFASDHKKTLTAIPGAPGAEIVIQRLPGRLLRAAAEAAQSHAMKQFRAAGPELLKEITAARQEGTAEETARKVDPLALFDQVELAKHGIVSWSFTKAISAEAIDDFEDDVLTYVARAVLEHTKPELFQSGQEREAADTKG